MEQPVPSPPQLIPPAPDPRLELPKVQRYLRVFGPKRLSQYLHHLYRLENGPLWFAFVAHNDAKCFTRFIKLVKPVKNPRSITGSQKYIAAARNDGFIF